MKPERPPEVPPCPPKVENNPWGDPTVHLCGIQPPHKGRHRCRATASCGMTWGDDADKSPAATADELRRRPYPVAPGSVPPTHPAASATALEAAEIIRESEEFNP